MIDLEIPIFVKMQLKWQCATIQESGTEYNWTIDVCETYFIRDTSTLRLCMYILVTRICSFKNLRFRFWYRWKFYTCTAGWAIKIGRLMYLVMLRAKIFQCKVENLKSKIFWQGHLRPDRASRERGSQNFYDFFKFSTLHWKIFWFNYNETVHIQTRP